MSEQAILLSFYLNDTDAGEALRQLRHARFRRSVSIHKSAEGRIRTDGSSLRHGVFWGIVSGLLCGVLAGIGMARLPWLFGGVAGYLALGMPVLAGWVIGWFTIRRVSLGLDEKLVENHARWLTADETVVIVQDFPEAVSRAISLLRSTGESQPAIFIIRRQPGGPIDGEPVQGEPLAAARLQRYARRLASTHRVKADVGREEPLLRQLGLCEEVIERVRQELAEASRMEHTISATAEWILDNAYIIQGQIDDVRMHLPKKFYHELPVLASEPGNGQPRIYHLAAELIQHADSYLDRNNINEFLTAYQSVSPLTISELWAAPLMLRIALLDILRRLTEQIDRRLHEQERADFWANRLLTAARRDPNQLFFILAELAREQPDPSAHFAFQLTGPLYDAEAALVPVRSWLERTLGRGLGETVIQGESRQAADQVSIGNAITSLRQLSRLDWREIFERQSRVEAILCNDPAGVYHRMDFATKDRYRHAVEEISRDSTTSEEGVAQAAVEMAGGHPDRAAGDQRLGHVGYYLIDEGRHALVSQLQGHEKSRYRALQWVYRHHTVLYLSAIGSATALIIGAIFGYGVWMTGRAGLTAVAALLALLPASELAIQAVNYLVTRLVPPGTLPKMSFEKEGIPDEFRTLVVVPMLFLDRRTIREDLYKLEVRYCANPEANILFGLFGDLPDADTQHKDTDAGLLRQAVEGITGLNARYGEGRFYLFHREREWVETEGRFIGWERKRGKLEELNRLLNGASPRDGRKIVHVGDPHKLANIRYVITLDSDTQLPRASARRMIETISHPLNRARLSPDGRMVIGAYGVIQPRISISLPSAAATPFSRLYTDPVGTDPYTRAVSDVYQDLAGEASYLGKGIYEPRMFYRVLAGRFPEQLLLSHDLIEGAHVRVGLASDIELYEEFPPDYISYISRQHRWICGDWQIADWCMPRVPTPEGTRAPNPLSVLNRWKIFDNLRRSLVPVASAVLLVASWLLSPALGAAAGILVALPVIFSPLAQLLTWVTTAPGSGKVSWGELGHGISRSFVGAALIPHQAILATDAIVRVWYRRLVSTRRLLEWTPAQIAKWKTRGRAPAFLARVSLISLFSLGVGIAVWLREPAGLPLAAPFLALWLLSPLIVWRLCAKPRRKPPRGLVSRGDAQMLRSIARQSWRYFDDYVGPESGWLPPDNYQISHQNSIALRTSPTNIGLWLLSAVAAYDFGYLAGDEVIRRLGETFATLGGLVRYEGHLLNWYDLKTRAPFEPRYVSTVDSGNLLGCLWAMEHGIGDLTDGPLIGPQAIRGLYDALGILRDLIPRTPRDDELLGAMGALEKLLCDPPERLDEIIRRIRQAAAPAGVVAQVLRQGDGAGSEPSYWAEALVRQLAGWGAFVDRYLAWVEMLPAELEGVLIRLGPEVRDAPRQALREAPSARSLAAGAVPMYMALRAVRGKAGEHSAPLGEWIDRFSEAFSRAQGPAGELCARADDLLRRSRDLGNGMNMRFLYDPDRRLFSIGFNASEQRRDTSYYDLFASEARLGSFVAIARGDVPSAHWLAMARPFGSIGNRRVLLSWGGTMFEYLMPLLLQRVFPHSLLERACREAVGAQIAYARRQGVPWGISESAYSDLDANKTYQYQAFGVPGLGLKRGLEDDLVVAPYASMLGLLVDPAAAVRNLKWLARLGLHGGHGFFEAIDFGRQRRREGGRGVIVRAYMAHHQAMGFLAIDNFINDSVMQRRFHSDPRVRATESLLYERIPISPPRYQVPTRERAASRVMPTGIAPAAGRFETPHSVTPKTQLFCNGRYSLMVTSAGGGYSRWRDFDVTRWRADSTCDEWGAFCYIRDVRSDRVWCTTYQPVRGATDKYAVTFTVDRAEFRRSDGDIDTETEIVVSPEDDAEIRRIALVNRSGRKKKLELTSYMELALAPHGVDRQHPAFNKMFVCTEAIEKRGALLAFRRPRNLDDPPIYAAHCMTFETGTKGAMQFETDRGRFIGRGRTTGNPAALFGALSQSAGHVLDPIFSLRRTVVLEPGQRVHVSLVLCVAESRKDALALVEKYSDPQTITRELDLAWTYAQVELRRLRIEPDEARRFQQLASYMLYPSSKLRPAWDRLQQNRLGQSRLWPHGISGDLPIAAISIGESGDISLVRQMLQAHAYWRLHGLKADLVILNEESSGYEQPLQEELKRLVNSHSMHAGVDQPGGVFLRSADHIPDEDLTLILSAARIALVAARGPLSQQLGAPTEAAELPAPLPVRAIPEEPSLPLPFMELPYFNGLGGFTPDGREYAIYLGPGAHTPAPWVNVIANPSFGALVSESGAGFAWYGNSQQNRLTDWSNDPVSDTPSDALYIRDQETGKFWTPTPLPVREMDAYRARHGAGYTVFEHNSHAIQQELITFVPMDENGGEPVRVQRLRLRNDSSRIRRLAVTFYVEWTLGENREDSQTHVISQWDGETRTMLARNRYHPTYGDRVAFATISPAPNSYTADRTGFLGRNGTLAAPAAMKRTRLASRVWPGLDPCAAVQVALNLPPGENAEVTCLLGQAGSIEEVGRLVRKYRDPAEVEESLKRTIAWWDRLSGTIQVSTPEKSADILLNRWLPYQTLSSRIWGRTGFYQSSGAFGFRDQLQDVTAMVYAEPDIARRHILLAAGRQFSEGDVQHWWQPPSGAGIRTRCSDDMLWLPYVVARYVRFTGDAGILNERIPFIEDRVLDEKEHEVFMTPHESMDSATLYEHCRRAIVRGASSGPHGLPLIGSGDWNDGMNRVGIKGIGESVWLAWFLIDVLNAWAGMAELHGSPEHAAACREKARTLAEAVERHAWDGGWYLRAFYDDGTPLGSAASEEARIDSLPQSWAVLSGAADPERAARAVESALEQLVLKEENLVLLLAPPFDRTEKNPGYIKGYPPGVRENGGQYTHAALWLAMALCRRGDGDRAVSLLRMINPIERARDPEAVKRYRVEPYVTAGDVYRLPERVGQGGWTWYTGSAAWMYRIWIEEVLGMKISGKGLLIDPVIPPGWKQFGIRYRRGEALYDIAVENPEGARRGVAWVEMDGRRLEGSLIPLEELSIRHKVVVRMGKGDPGDAAAVKI